jgi:hypothetical protein
MEWLQNAYKIGLEIFKGRDNLGDLDMSGRIILKCISEK